MRICSLLPGATEILYRLGLGDQIVGVTHECDYPPEAQYKPVVVKSSIDSKRLSGGEIDRAVRAVLQGRKALYELDMEALASAAPDLILTQGLCDVCALDHRQVLEAAEKLARRPEIVTLNPHTLADVLGDIARVGAATNRLAVAQSVADDLRQRIEAAYSDGARGRPRVVCLEWFEPLYIAGHWVPELVDIAGGEDVMGRPGRPAVKVEWAAIVAAKPEVVLLMPCGFDVRRTAREATPLRALDGWGDLPAVRSGSVYALNGNAYFSRSGPRLVDGLGILSRILDPGRVPISLSPSDAKRVIH